MALKIYDYRIGMCDKEGKWEYTNIMKESFDTYMNTVSDYMKRGDILCASVRNIHADERRKKAN